MNFFTVVALITAFATVFALASGISSMATDGEVGHVDGAHWMVRRVVFQAVCLLLVVLGIHFTS